MTETQNKFGIFSGNILKFIAAAAMICDHMGVILFPNLEFLRIIGRLSFPIFAFMISEGAKYTKNRLRYLATMAGFALVIQVVYYVYNQSLEMSVLVTFTLSLCMIYALDLFKRALTRPSLTPKILTALLFFFSIVAVSAIDKAVDLDYGFAGCMLPVFASLFVKPRDVELPLLARLDRLSFRLCATAVGLFLLAYASPAVQYWSFLSIPLLALYSGQRGRLRTKYFFYVFYPLHLVILQCIAWLIG